MNEDKKYEAACNIAAILGALVASFYEPSFRYIVVYTLALIYFKIDEKL